MAKAERKIMLFIVEGLSDKVSFEGLFVKFFSSFEVQVAVMRCDVTLKACASEIKVYLNSKIEDFCCIEKVSKTDIKGIVHLVDMDGAFAPDSCIKQNSADETVYSECEILAKNKDAIIERNHKKSSVLVTLSSMVQLAKIPYRIYFLSRTLEHVLHNKIEKLTDKEKTLLSESFDDLYAENFEGFLSFISDEAFAVKGDYKQSWNFIQQGVNSLKRYSNLHLLFR